MIDVSHPASPLRITTEQHPGSVLVVRVCGQVDADSSRVFDHYLRTRLPAHVRHVVVDTSDVTLLSARGVRTLIEHADRLARQGNHLLVVRSTPHVRRVLEAAHVTAHLHLHDNVQLALKACEGSGEQTDHPADTTRTPDQPADQATALPHELQELRIALRTRTVISTAVGVVQERYHLATPASAFDVLRHSARSHNLRLYTLANALLDKARPQGPT